MRAIRINKFIAYFHWSNSLVLHNNNKHFAAVIILCAVLSDLLLCEACGRQATAAQQQQLRQQLLARFASELSQLFLAAFATILCTHLAASVCVCVRDFMFLQMA